MLQELTREEAMNEVYFIQSMKIIQIMLDAEVIRQSEFEIIKAKLIEKYQPYLGELM